MTPRTLIAVAGLLIAGLLLVWQLGRLLDDPTVWPPDDFVEYWAAGRLCLHGQDPYAPGLLLPLEREAGRDTDEAVMMWNPPWTLPVAMPIGAMPARVAQLVWLFVGLAAVGVSADRLWAAYRGPADRRWVAWAVAFTFVPTGIVLNVGQIGPLLLLGAAGFVCLERAGRPLLAGAAAVLLAIKPHLAYLLWLALAVDAVAHRRWRLLAGGLTVGAVAAVIPLAFNPDVYAQYLAAFRDHPPAQWVSLTLGTLLRVVFGEGRFWLQFVPVLLGVGWFAWHWRRHARDWDWGEQVPLLLLVSFVTSPYGAWHFDLVVLLVPLVHLAARLADRPAAPVTRAAVAVYVGADLVMLGLNLAEVKSIAFAWCAPLVLGLYLLAGRRAFPAPAAAPA